MDEETARLLDEWGLSCLQERFHENMIDVSILKMLTEEDLRQLIQPIGLMIKFREKWKSWLAKETDTDLINTLLQSESSESLSRPSTSTSGLLGDSSQQLRGDKDLSNLPSEGILSLDFMLAIDSDFVEQVLNSSIDGKGLLVSGAVTGGLLNESQRKELGRIIIKNIIDKDPEAKIQSVTFSRLSLQISKLFPKEAPALYFTPSIAASAQTSKRKRNASGILYEVYVNRRRKLRELGLLPTSGNIRSRSSSISIDASLPTSPRSTDPDAPEVEEKLQWLNNNIEPWKKVESYWEETAVSRLKCLEEKGSVIEYFNKYPCLKHHQGYKLLLQDFEHLFPGKENILINSIVTYKDKILSISKEKGRILRDKERKLILKNLITIASDSSSPHSHLATLLLLTHLLNIRGATKKQGKQAYKPSKSEIQEAFITFTPSDTDILATVDERKRKYERYGLTLQPFVLLVGSVEEVKECKVIVDTTIYDVPTALEAVDTVFKLIHATNACYQEETDQLWLFVQLAFYKITTKFDRPTQTIRNLINDLEITV